MERINRVAIVDFDVHHCNGTVDIFKDRPEVLVCLLSGTLLPPPISRFY
ncbi:MAG: hypothetical protein ACNYPE_09330 [Candidatus Azotimanducaceae bacterium WSBS_2022_MAG_OTU7]